MLNEQAVVDILERVRGRFFGKYRGTVTDVDDDTKRGRIKAKVPSVLGDRKTGWCAPCVPYAGKDAGMLFLPEKGAGVWIEFEGGDVSRPIWSGCYFRVGELPAAAAPKVKIIHTPGGQEILLDDDAGSVTVSDTNGNTVTLDSSGITLERAGKKVVVNDAGVNVNDGALEVVMAGLLNMGSVLMCPHGGTVQATTSNTKAKAAGDFFVRASDTFVIAGCPFVLGIVPHPCVRVQWVQPSLKTTAVSDAALTEQSVGLCLAADNAVQGTVLITTTQQKVTGL